MRLKGRTDSNHTEIVKALRKCGALVLSLANLGKGAPDWFSEQAKTTFSK